MYIAIVDYIVSEFKKINPEFVKFERAQVFRYEDKVIVVDEYGRYNGVTDSTGTGGYIRQTGPLNYAELESKTSCAPNNIAVGAPFRIFSYGYGINNYALEERVRGSLIHINALLQGTPDLFITERNIRLNMSRGYTEWQDLIPNELNVTGFQWKPGLVATAVDFTLVWEWVLNPCLHLNLC